MQHESLSQGQWQKLSLAEQLGNIGSEVGRALRAQAQNLPQRASAAQARALELFDLTLADDQWRGRRKELARAREHSCYFFETKQPVHETAKLEKYFMDFALLVRKNR